MGYASDHSSSKVQSERVISLEEGEELEEDVDGMKYEKENMIKKSASSSDISSEQGSIHVFLIRDSLYCLSLNFLNFSRN